MTTLTVAFLVIQTKMIVKYFSNGFFYENEKGQFYLDSYRTFL